MAANCTENPSSCDQLLLCCSLAQKQWGWLWIQGAPSNLDAPKDVHDPSPDTLTAPPCQGSVWLPLASGHELSLLLCCHPGAESPMPTAWAAPAILLLPVGSQHAEAELAPGLQQHDGRKQFSEPALGKATGSRGGSCSIPFLKGEEHLLILAPTVLCCELLVQPLRAAWLSGEMCVCSVSFPDQGTREGQERTVAFWVNGK